LNDRTCAEQIVGRERRERVSQLHGAAKGALIRAAASTQPLGGTILNGWCPKSEILMRRLPIRLFVAVLTFAIGVVVSSFWFAYRLPAVVTLGIPLCAGPPNYETTSSVPCSGTNLSALSSLPVVRYCDLVGHSSSHNNQIVRVRGIYSFNMENSALYDPACPDEDAWTWVEVETCSNFDEHSANLRRNQVAEVVFLGRFSGPSEQGYGHLNGYRYKLSVMRVEEMKPLALDAR
jgi:hypothetical protein